MSKLDEDEFVDKIDPVCLLHGKRISEHDCLYCSICYKDLTPADCNVTESGDLEDVCHQCAAEEKSSSR